MYKTIILAVLAVALVYGQYQILEFIRYGESSVGMNPALFSAMIVWFATPTWLAVLDDMKISDVTSRILIGYPGGYLVVRMMMGLFIALDGVVCMFLHWLIQSPDIWVSLIVMTFGLLMLLPVSKCRHSFPDIV